MPRSAPIRATTWRKHLKRRTQPRSVKHPRGRAVPRLPLREPFYTSYELQQYEYLVALGATSEGIATPEYSEERRAWIATQRRAAKRFGARRARKRPPGVPASGRAS